MINTCMSPILLLRMMLGLEMLSSFYQKQKKEKKLNIGRGIIISCNQWRVRRNKTKQWRANHCYALCTDAPKP